MTKEADRHERFGARRDGGFYFIHGEIVTARFDVHVVYEKKIDVTAERVQERAGEAEIIASVCTGALMNRMVSYIAKPLVTTPPGELM